MSVALTYAQIAKRFAEREDKFRETLVDQMKPRLPIVINSYEALAEFCSDVITAYLDTIFKEE